MNYKIQLDKVNKFLLSKNWTFEDMGSLLSKIKNIIQGNPYEFVIPKSEELEDYEFRINQFLKAISNLYQKDISEFIDEINNMGYDILKLRFKSEETEEGNFPLPEFSRAVENVKNLIKYGACSEYEQKSQYKRPYDGAIDLMETTQVGQTEVGSYVFVVKIPSNKNDDEKSKNLGRKTIKRILTGIQEAKNLEIIDEDNFKETYGKKLNRNVCEALSNLLHDEDFDERFNLELSVQWDTLDDSEEDKLELIDIESEIFSSKFKKMASYLKQIPEPSDTRIKGRIQIMKNPEDAEAQEKRLVVVYDNYERKNIYIMLNETNYRLACDAHKNENEISISGHLNKKSSHWFLDNTTNFQVNLKN